jgi:hypothetical protein
MLYDYSSYFSCFICFFFHVLEVRKQAPPQAADKVPSTIPRFNLALCGTNRSPERAELCGTAPRRGPASAKLKIQVRSHLDFHPLLVDV